MRAVFASAVLLALASVQAAPSGEFDPSEADVERAAAVITAVIGRQETIDQSILEARVWASEQLKSPKSGYWEPVPKSGHGILVKHLNDVPAEDPEGSPVWDATLAARPNTTVYEINYSVTDHKGKSLTTRKGFRLQRAKTFDGMKFALDYLKVGQRAQFVVSSIFAYNQNEWKTPPSLGAKPFLPAKSVLVCDVELLDVHKFGDKM